MLSALLDHLWQSTVLALLVGLAVLTLRKAPASARYGLWFAASAKFLVPFAALAALGRFAAPQLSALLPHAPAHAAPPVVFPDAALIEKAAEPLARFPLPPSSPLLQAPLPPAGPGPAVQMVHQPAPHAALHLDPLLILAAVWALGFCAVLVRWTIRWTRVRRALRSATPLDWPAPMPVLASPTLLEPGLVGFLRPVLVVPESLPQHLTRSQIDAILAHEVCHLRRRDNLTAALHTLVEAVCWFHPLVWWIGTRLIAERESACDEAVIRAGHDRATYARSLVESARLYVQSPLSCVAGASGSNLKARVEAIMTAPPVLPLSLTRKLLLAAAGACVVATPVAAALVTAPDGQTPTQARTVLAAVLAPARDHAILETPAAPVPAQVTDQAAAPPLVVAERETILSPPPTVVAPAAAPLTQDLAAPRIEIAAASPPSATPIAAAPKPADFDTEAASFVDAYAVATPGKHLVARWLSPICVRVVGLSSGQAAAVGARIEEIARQLGLPVQAQGCKRDDIQIGFTAQPQQMLDEVIKSKAKALGDKTSGTEGVTTVTLPIQAWYATNGSDMALNDAGGLKALVDDRRSWSDVGRNGLKVLVSTAQTSAVPPAAQLPSSNYSNEAPTTVPYTGEFNDDLQAKAWYGGIRERGGPRQFLNVFVIVDLRRTGQIRLGEITDYVAMLALAQARAADSCKPLPSITDLFAACPGRAASGGLTPADVAYLAALYENPRSRGAKAEDLSARMAKILATTKVASR